MDRKLKSCTGVLLRKKKKKFFLDKQLFFLLTKNFFQGTTLVQFFMYCKAKKNFGAIRKIFKILIFQNLLSKYGSERGDFNFCG